MNPATAPTSSVIPKILHQSPRTSRDERRSAPIGPWLSKTTTEGARLNFTQSQVASGAVARAPRTPIRITAICPPPSVLTAAITMATKPIQASRIGTSTISQVSSTVPTTAGIRLQARRQTAENVVGRPRTASWRTAGTAAYIRAVEITVAIRATSATELKAMSSGTQSSARGSSSEPSARIRSRWSATAEYAIAAAVSTKASAPPYAAAPTPSNCLP